MAKKTHPHKRSSVRKAAKRKPSAIASWTYRSRIKIALALIGSVLLATASFAYWNAPEIEVIALAPVISETVNKSPVKDLSTLTAKELSAIPPEAFHPQPPMPAGYNAHSAGLPPGALPPGVVLPGMPMVQGARTTVQGYGMSDGVRQQFTSQERDIETGLDYFGARYYSSAQGRFTSVDPQNGGAVLTNPQSWNGYSYALNNPLRFIDPDGLRWAQAAVVGGIQYQWFDDVEKDKNGQTAYSRALGGGWSGVDFDESKPFSFTSGILAPGETLTTVTLSPNGPGSSTISTHVVTWGEWTKFLYLNTLTDSLFGTHHETDQLNDFVSSIVGARTEASGNGPDVPGPALGTFGEPNVSIEKQLAGKGQLKDLRANPNLKGVDIDNLLKKTPAQLEQMAKEGKITQRVVKTIKKAFEGRDLGGRGNIK